MGDYDLAYKKTKEYDALTEPLTSADQVIVIKNNNIFKTGVSDLLLSPDTISRNTESTTLDGSAYHWLGNTDGGTFIYRLPAGVSGTTYRIVNTGTSGNNLTITPNGSENLLGANSSFTLSDGEALVIVYDSTDGWY